MKASSRFLSVFLVLVLMLSCSACASGTGTAAGAEKAGKEGTGENLSARADSTTELFLSLTEKTSKSLAFPLTKEGVEFPGCARQVIQEMDLLEDNVILALTLGECNWSMLK